MAIASFLVQAVLLSMSGVMAPGPVTAATLAGGARRAGAGSWIAVGHAVVEFPLMGLILLGVGAWLSRPAFQKGIGLAGGVVLLVMTAMMLRDLRKPAAAGPAATDRPARPLWTGIVLTGGNPYFLLWWATVGLKLSTQAADLGVLAFALFAVMHWTCDLLWLTALSLASHKGIAILGPRAQRAVTVICALAMAVFGVKFLADAVMRS
jgi:threonine/homoserine/homoserine lactone efflux protein